MARPKCKTSAQSSATIGCEAKLWLTADKLRNNMDAAEYKHVVLGLIFLKYISDTFEEHRADYVLANPPFNDSDWFRKDDDVRFFSLSASNGERAGVRCRNDLPPKGNANFAWVQHFIHHLAPHGMAGFVLANGSMSSNQSGDCNARSARRNWATDSQGLGSQRDIRRALIEADLVDCMVAQS